MSDLSTDKSYESSGDISVSYTHLDVYKRQLHKDYVDFMQEYLNLGHMSPLDSYDLSIKHFLSTSPSRL